MSITENLKQKAINTANYKKCQLIKQKIDDRSPFLFLGIGLYFCSIFLSKIFKNDFAKNLNGKTDFIFLSTVLIFILVFFYFVSYREKLILKRYGVNSEEVENTLNFANVKIQEDQINILKKELNPLSDKDATNILNEFNLKSLNDMISLEIDFKRYTIMEEAFKDLSEDNNVVKRTPYNYRFVHYFTLKKSDLYILKKNKKYIESINEFIKNKESLNIKRLHSYIINSQQ